MLFKKKDIEDYYSTGVEKFNTGEYMLAIEYFQAELEKHPDNTEAKLYIEKAEKEIQQQRLNLNTKFKRTQSSKYSHPPQTSSQTISNNQTSPNSQSAKKTSNSKWFEISRADVIMWIVGGVLLLFMFYLIVHYRDGLKYPYGLYFFGYAFCIFIVSAIVVAIFDDSGFDGWAIMALLASPFAVWFFMKCIGPHPVALAIVFFVLTGLCGFITYKNKDEEIRKFFLTSGAFCAMWTLFFIVPVVWKPIAENQIAKVEKRLDASKMQIHQHADSLRTQRQTQTREAGFMGLMIGDNYDEVLSKCKETESILAVSPYTPSSYEEKVKGIEFDSVLKIKALWDNNEVDAKVYFLNSKLSAIRFGLKTTDSIISTYNTKYGEPEMRVNWSRIEPQSRSYPHWSEENRHFPYYESLYICWSHSKRATLNTVDYSWTYSNASVSLIQGGGWYDYWTVEYVASWVLDTMRMRHERDSLIKVQEQLEEEQHKREENRARRQAAIEEKKRRDESHWRAVDNI